MLNNSIFVPGFSVHLPAEARTLDTISPDSHARKCPFRDLYKGPYRKTFATHLRAAMETYVKEQLQVAKITDLQLGPIDQLASTGIGSRCPCIVDFVWRRLFSEIKPSSVNGPIPKLFARLSSFEPPTDSDVWDQMLVDLWVFGQQSQWGQRQSVCWTLRGAAQFFVRRAHVKPKTFCLVMEPLYGQRFLHSRLIDCPEGNSLVDLALSGQKRELSLVILFVMKIWQSNQDVMRVLADIALANEAVGREFSVSELTALLSVSDQQRFLLRAIRRGVAVEEPALVRILAEMKSDVLGQSFALLHQDLMTKRRVYEGLVESRNYLKLLMKGAMKRSTFVKEDEWQLTEALAVEIRWIHEKSQQILKTAERLGLCSASSYERGLILVLASFVIKDAVDRDCGVDLSAFLAELNTNSETLTAMQADLLCFCIREDVRISLLMPERELTE